MSTNQFVLGQKLRHRVSGLEGIAVSRTEYLSGCVRYGVQPRVTSSSPEKLPDASWFDVEELEFVDGGVSEISGRPSGGDRMDPPSRHSAP